MGLQVLSTVMASWFHLASNIYIKQARTKSDFPCHLEFIRDSSSHQVFGEEAGDAPKADGH